MVDRRIEEIFKSYAKKFEPLENGIFGYFNGLTDPMLKVRAVNLIDGKLFLSSPQIAKGYNCTRCALEMADELRKLGLQAKPKYVMSREGYQQSYVLVFDPETEQWVQMDATPWFKKIGTLHEETGDLKTAPNIDLSCLTIGNNDGQFVATRVLEDGSFLDAYIAGGYSSTTSHVELLKEKIPSERITPDDFSTPYYSFVLFVRQGYSSTEKLTSFAGIYFDILDSTKIAQVKSQLKENEWLANPRECLEKLIEAGAAKVRVERYLDDLINKWRESVGIKCELSGETSFDYLNNDTRYGTTKEVRDWLLANLPVLANVVFNVGPELRTFDNEALEVSNNVFIPLVIEQMPRYRD
ncbi:hypothetical protein HYU06_03755 [Candidatus Woesearchaeota archaeon]|nr:hypothetical protein [Candidatus Woesearchaeota archaeon]